MISLEQFYNSDTVDYHYGSFPPSNLNYDKIAMPLADAAAAVARYEQMLKDIHNTRLFITPLQRQEAIASSAMEGTLSTLEELLLYEANINEANSNEIARSNAFEVHAYRRAIHQAETEINRGKAISPELLCECHKILLHDTRGHDKRPGRFKSNQNLLINHTTGKATFVPISPDLLEDGLNKLFKFISESDHHPLITTAIAHIEFEALHPFDDGNGRIGRILIKLMMWELGLISNPHFYISGYLEKYKQTYIRSMREVSSNGDWISWCVFFLESVQGQANENLAISQRIQDLYTEMRQEFLDISTTKWYGIALDFIFKNPIFVISNFVEEGNIPYDTARTVIKKLKDKNLVMELRPAAGRLPAIYAFGRLLNILHRI